MRDHKSVFICENEFINTIDIETGTVYLSYPAGQGRNTSFWSNRVVLHIKIFIYSTNEKFQIQFFFDSLTTDSLETVGKLELKEVKNLEGIQEFEEIQFICSLETRPAGFTRFHWFLQFTEGLTVLILDSNIHFEQRNVSEFVNSYLRVAIGLLLF